MKTKTITAAAAIVMALSGYAFAQSGTSSSTTSPSGAMSGKNDSSVKKGSSTTNSKGGQTGTQGAGGTGSSMNGTMDRNDSTSRPGGTNPTGPR